MSGYDPAVYADEIARIKSRCREHGMLLAKIRPDPQFNFSIFTFQLARSTAYQDLIITSVDYHIWK
jgi:hypothetical protein